MKRITFCSNCPTACAEPLQEVYWAGNRAYCSQTCDSYLDALKRDNREKDLEAVDRYMEHQLELFGGSHGSARHAPVYPKR